MSVGRSRQVMAAARCAAVALLATTGACTPAAPAPPASDSRPAAPPTSDAAPAPTLPPQSAGFTRTIELQGITFRVSCPNQGSLNQLRIEPEGLLTDNSPMVQEVEGSVTGAEVADLNADGSPEIYVYVQSAGSGSYGSLVAYSANALKSLSGIYLAPTADDPKLSKGYMGHDEFAIVGNRLVQRFPIYTDADTNAQPTGGTRQVYYRLDAGEAGWVLRVEKAIDQ